MDDTRKGCGFIELELFSQIVAWISILVSLFNIFGWFILGFHWFYIMAYIFMGPFAIVASVFLLRSSKNKNPDYVIPWLIMAVVEFIMTIINQTIYLTHYLDKLSANDVDAHVIGLFVGFIIFMYFWLYMYAYYQKLHRECVLTKFRI